MKMKVMDIVEYPFWTILEGEEGGEVVWDWWDNDLGQVNYMVLQFQLKGQDCLVGGTALFLSPALPYLIKPMALN